MNLYLNRFLILSNSKNYDGEGSKSRECEVCVPEKLQLDFLENTEVGAECQGPNLCLLRLRRFGKLLEITTLLFCFLFFSLQFFASEEKRRVVSIYYYYLFLLSFVTGARHLLLATS